MHVGCEARSRFQGWSRLVSHEKSPVPRLGGLWYLQVEPCLQPPQALHEATLILIICASPRRRSSRLTSTVDRLGSTHIYRKSTSWCRGVAGELGFPIIRYTLGRSSRSFPCSLRLSIFVPFPFLSFVARKVLI